MPTARDYLIATVMGEDNRADAQGMQGIVDVILNRQGQASSYGARSNSIQDIVTARNGMEFNAWRPSDNSYDRTTRALQGIDAMRGAEVGQYRQAAQVVDDMLERGIGRGISQGSTFYQTPDAPNRYQSGTLWPRYGSVTIGNHVYTGPQLVRDRAEYERRNPDLFTSQQAPFPQQDGFGVIFNPGDALGTGAGDVDNFGHPYETGDRYGFSGGNFAGDAGNGAFGLGGAYPNQDVNPLAFGSAYNVGGGRPGAFTDFLPPVQTGDPFGFTGLDTGGGVGNGSFGNGIVQPGPAPDPFAFSGANMGGGVGAGTLGQLPAGFDPAAYLRANPDVAAAGVDPRQHYLSFGAQEGRSLGVPGLIPTQGPSGSTSTLGPFDTASTLGNPFSTPTLGAGSTASTIGAPTGFDARSYIDANADIRALGFTPDQAVQHFRDYGQYEVRPLAPGQEARVHAAPGLSPTFGSGTTAPTFGPDGSVNVMSTGLTPTLGPNGFASTIGPGGTVPSFSPGGDTSYLTMPSTTATPFGPPDASSALPAGFDAMSYVAANPDLKALGFNGQQATQHFMDYGQFEARPLAPGMEARVYAPPGLTPTQGPTNTASTIGPGALTPTFSAPDLTSTIGPPALTGTYGPPATTPTIGAGNPVPSWSPFGGAGIGSPFSFSGANVGSGLGAGPQSFGSLWPVGSGVSEPAPTTDPGSAGLGPFDFSNANVGGFDVNALGGGGGGGTSGPNSVNDMGISGGFDSEGAMRRVLEQQAADLRKADQAAKTVMHSDPNAFNVAIANGGNTVGMGTALQTPGAIGGPVVPNLTVRNYATSAPGAMFSMFAPWR